VASFVDLEGRKEFHIPPEWHLWSIRARMARHVLSSPDPTLVIDGSEAEAGFQPQRPSVYDEKVANGSAKCVPPLA
jgi:hypothetical protein